MKYSFDDHDTSTVSALIDEKIHNAQYRLILKLRFNDHLTYHEITEHDGVKINSERQIGKIISDYAPKLKKLIET